MTPPPATISGVRADRSTPPARVPGRGVRHGLVVAGQGVRRARGGGRGRLERRLGAGRHVAVPEDAEAASEGPLLGAVALGPLDGEEADQRLGDGEAYRARA